MRLRSWVGVIVVSAVLAVTAGAWAQTYPDRPVRMLIAFPGGGTIDTLGRILAMCAMMVAMLPYHACRRYGRVTP
jgi:tripartite-type tricarboxylate transporter receptor subunit TctC